MTHWNWSPHFLSLIFKMETEKGPLVGNFSFGFFHSFFFGTIRPKVGGVKKKRGKGGAEQAWDGTQICFLFIGDWFYFNFEKKRSALPKTTLHFSKPLIKGKRGGEGILRPSWLSRSRLPTRGNNRFSIKLWYHQISDTNIRKLQGWSEGNYITSQKWCK